MRARAALTALVVALPAAAMAQNANVPGLKTGTHLASAGPQRLLPPPIQLVSPSAKLSPKERHAAILAQRWRRRPEMPHAGPDGVVRYLYGATIPSIVCAPLHVCTLELQRGEIVPPNGVKLGDTVRWQVTAGMAGVGANARTLIYIKPDDAGLRTNMTIATNRRVYTVNLVSMRYQWTPLVGFNYPSDTRAQWAEYERQAQFVAAAQGMPDGQNAADLDFNYVIRGPNVPWKPLRVYSNGTTTYIDFAAAAAHHSFPVLVELSGGGLFSAPRENVVNYRLEGNSLVVDGVITRAALIEGVGSNQRRVTITAGKQ